MCHQIMYKKLLYLILDSGNGYIKESNGNEYLTLIATDESQNTLKRYGKYGAKLKILLDQKMITQMITMKNIRKSNSIQVMTYL